MPLPPGPSGPSALVTAQFAARPLGSLTRWQRRYGDAFTVRLTGFGPGVYVADPAAVRELFTGDQSDLLAGEANSFLTPILGEHSVLVLDGPRHLRQRKLLLPPFQGSRVAGFREIIREVAEREVASWHAGQQLVLRARMRALTFEVICRAVFGVTEPARVAALQQALGAVLDSASILLVSPRLRTDLGPWSPGGRLARRLATADALIHEEIGRRRGADDLEDREDVLSLLLRARDEEGRALTDAELRDELVTMLAAGHETTATALAFAFELLLRTAGAWGRARAAALEGDDAHLDAVGRETLRLRPVLDAAERTLTRPRDVAGWELPAGAKVYPAIALIHRRPDLYEAPLAFRPERFTHGDAQAYSWLPFGGGIRRCIGAALAQAELTEVLRVVLPAVDLELVRRTQDPVVLTGITLSPKYGVPVRVGSVRPARAAAPAAPSRSSSSAALR
jgi:cytochrome P450 family 135